MPAVYSNGLSSVSFGNIAGDGGPAVAWDVIGSTKQGSMRLVSAEGTTSEFFIEELTEPILKKILAGSMTITWICLDMSHLTLQKLMGGTIDGSGVAGDEFEYHAPVAGVQAMEKSLKIVNGNGVTLTICRASVFANWDMAFTKDDIGGININATILLPTKANEPPYKFKYPAN